MHTIQSENVEVAARLLEEAESNAYQQPKNIASALDSGDRASVIEAIKSVRAEFVGLEALASRYNSLKALNELIDRLDAVLRVAKSGTRSQLAEAYKSALRTMIKGHKTVSHFVPMGNPGGNKFREAVLQSQRSAALIRG